jgi:hypothetical protein
MAYQKKGASKILKNHKAKKKYYYICEECRSRYESTEDTPPPGIAFSDGHKCVPVKDVEREDAQKALRSGRPADTNTY